MSTTAVRIADDSGEQAEVMVKKMHSSAQGFAFKVCVDFNPEEYVDASSYMVYTPDQARQLAVYLMEAAHRAEKGVL